MSTDTVKGFAGEAFCPVHGWSLFQRTVARALVCAECSADKVFARAVLRETKETLRQVLNRGGT